MHYLTSTLLLAGVFVLVFGLAMVIRALFEFRRKRTAPFHDYFGPEYNRDLLQHSELSETEDWQADRRSRFAPFRLRDPKPSEQRTRSSNVTRRNHESN